MEYEDGTFAGADTPTKGVAAANAIREAIQGGRLRPGDRLPLPQLAEQLDMSYTPVREGLKQLQSEGLVVYRPHHGNIVAPFNPARAAEIYLIRDLLEPAASALAAERATAAQLDEMCASLELLDAAVAAGAKDQIPKLNALFHRKIYVAAASPMLLEHIDRLWNGVPYQAISLIDHAHESSNDHAEILAAVSSRDSAAAESRMHAHIARGAVAAMSALEPQES